jgi:3-oxoacyl-[acyl-carrier protein] reductase
VSGRQILITGANRGIGEALARHYLDLGDRVVGCGRGAASLEHDGYRHFRVDVTAEGDVRAMFDELRRECARLDCLINNAGIASMNPIALTPFSTAKQIVEVNFLGTFLFTNAAIRLLRKSANPRIVNLTTVAVPLRLEGEAVYAASKAAVETFTRVTAREVGRMGITCNAVGPSPIRTRLLQGVPNDKLNTLVERQAIPAWAEPGDVINVVDFFLRPESRLITGQVIYLGGLG